MIWIEISLRRPDVAASTLVVEASRSLRGFSSLLLRLQPPVGA
jgi:hypothetical protein